MEQVELKEVIDYTGVVRVEHRYSKEDDRWVYMEFNEHGDLRGLNYCQGDDYEFFMKYYASSDPVLLEFYNDAYSTLKTYLREDISEFELINTILWLSWDARNFADNLLMSGKK